jgi:hypothetical protein
LALGRAASDFTKRVLQQERRRRMISASTCRCLAPAWASDVGEFCDRIPSHRLIKSHFLGAQLDLQGNFCAGGQFIQHLGFGTPQDEGLNQLLQAVSGLLILMALDGVGKLLVELVQGTEEARIDEPEQVPQFPQVVFDGGAGSDHLKAPLQLHRRLGAFGGRVFDGLGLVQHDGLPFHPGQHFGHILLLEQTVAAHQHVERLEVVD